VKSLPSATTVGLAATLPQYRVFRPLTTTACYSILRDVQQQVLKSKAMQQVERRLGEPIEVYLQRRYHTDGLTLRDVAGELGLSVGTVSRWLAHLGIEARFPGQRGTPSEAVA